MTKLGEIFCIIAGSCSVLMQHKAKMIVYTDNWVFIFYD